MADVEKPITEHLQDLQNAYPNIEVSKIFQQLLICQKKIILSGNMIFSLNDIDLNISKHHIIL